MQWRMFDKFSKHSKYVWKKPLLQMDNFITSFQYQEIAVSRKFKIYTQLLQLIQHFKPQTLGNIKQLFKKYGTQTMPQEVTSQFLVLNSYPT